MYIYFPRHPLPPVDIKNKITAAFFEFLEDDAPQRQDTAAPYYAIRAATLTESRGRTPQHAHLSPAPVNTRLTPSLPQILIALPLPPPLLLPLAPPIRSSSALPPPFLPLYFSSLPRSGKVRGRRGGRGRGEGGAGGGEGKKGERGGWRGGGGGFAVRKEVLEALRSK